jgi:hypothetical protein
LSRGSWATVAITAGGGLLGGAEAYWFTRERKVSVTRSTGSVKVEEKKYGSMDKGPLPNDIANTFRSNTYTQKVSTGEYVYRVYGGAAQPNGSYYSRIPQNGGMQSQFDLALNPDWGNTATNVSQFYIPPGTVYFEGYAASQIINGGAGTLMGGGNQIYVPRH